MKVVSKKTTELTQGELEQIASLVKDVFGREISPDSIRTNYLGNNYGTSYHILLYDEEKLVGHNAGMPGVYIVGDKICKSLNNVGLMITKDHRGISTFMILLKEAYAFYQREGVHFLYSLPNTNSYPILTKLKYMKDIGHVATYCLPYNIGGVKRKLKAFNFLSKFFCRLFVNTASLVASKRIWHPQIHKKQESFKAVRYNRVKSDYILCDINGNRFVYAFQDYQGIKSVILIDVEDKSEANFCVAVRYILKKEKNKFDILLYVGNLPFKITGLIKVPSKYEPKPFRLVGHVFDESYLSEQEVKSIFELNNWDINLSDDDVV